MFTVTMNNVLSLDMLSYIYFVSLYVVYIYQYIFQLTLTQSQKVSVVVSKGHRPDFRSHIRHVQHIFYDQSKPALDDSQWKTPWWEMGPTSSV